MKNVCVPSELVYTKYQSSQGVRTRSCIAAMTFDSHSTLLTSLRRAAARHLPIVWSYTSCGMLPGVSDVNLFIRVVGVSSPDDGEGERERGVVGLATSSVNEPLPLLRGGFDGCTPSETSLTWTA